MTDDGSVEVGVDPRDLDGATLDSALVEQRLAIVEFWADWCLFSRLLYPRSRYLAAKYRDRLLVARCRLEGDEAAVERFDIRYLPAVALFRGKKLLRKWYGDVPIGTLAHSIEDYCGADE